MVSGKRLALSEVSLYPEYLKEFHPSPERFVGRPVEIRNRKLNDKEIVDSDDIEAVRDHRETRTGRPRYLKHYRNTADHDDVGEHAEHVAQNASGKAAADRYWNDLNEQAQVDAVGKKEKKARKLLKPKTSDANKTKESDVAELPQSAETQKNASEDRNAADAAGEPERQPKRAPKQATNATRNAEKHVKRQG
jgi:hypothetical protein